MPSLTFIASVNVIVHAGAKPVFVDIDPRTFNLDPADAARKIGPRTRAILPVDQLGMPCEIDAILELAKARGLLVIQDAACAIGSRFRERPIGGIAPITIFSLHARKVVTTGEGGMIVTNDAPLAVRLRMLRHQGMSLSDFERHAAGPTTFESYPEIGYNFRITDIQAAIGSLSARPFRRYAGAAAQDCRALYRRALRSPLHRAALRAGACHAELAILPGARAT